MQLFTNYDINEKNEIIYKRLVDRLGSTHCEITEAYGQVPNAKAFRFNDKHYKWKQVYEWVHEIEKEVVLELDLIFNDSRTRYIYYTKKEIYETLKRISENYDHEHYKDALDLLDRYFHNVITSLSSSKRYYIATSSQHGYIIRFEDTN